MSGGSYDYAYNKVGDFDFMVRKLREMAASHRKHCLDIKTKSVRTELGRFEQPVTVEDRANIMVRAIMLDDVADDLERVLAKLAAVEPIMQDIEWVDSCDSGPDELIRKVKR